MWLSGERLSATTTTTIAPCEVGKGGEQVEDYEQEACCGEDDDAGRRVRPRDDEGGMVATASTTVVHAAVVQRPQGSGGAADARYYERFTASSFADNLTLGDVTEGEDPVVREAAIEALGNMNGTAVAIDPSNGRILAMVNQKLALSRGAEPCSTIKLTVALAALEEGNDTKDTPVNLGGRYTDLTRRWRTRTIFISRRWAGRWALSG